MSSSTMKKLQSQLQQFIETGSSFQVVYSTHSSPITTQTSRLCILDSSFNPPHKGHLSLIIKSIKNSKEPIESISVLLLLSVKNADKVVPEPASFEDRLEMMCLLADYIQQNFKVTVSVALTNHAKFVEKSDVIRKWVREVQEDIDHSKFLFLVGFDTLIRIFDPRYYAPLKIGDALAEFMDLNEFFCLTRKDDKSGDLDAQHKYVQSINDGKTELPSDWSKKIHLVEGDGDYLHISSSSIRKKSVLLESETVWRDEVIPTIAEYIYRHSLY